MQAYGGSIELDQSTEMGGLKVSILIPLKHGLE